MLADEVNELKDLLMGSKMELSDAMAALGIPETAENLAQVSQHVARCKVCGYWTDAAVVDDNGVCAACRE